MGLNRIRAWLAAIALAHTLGSAGTARAQAVHDPQGKVLVGGSAGVTVRDGSTAGTIGLQVGYAVIDGLVPGIRGMVLFGDFGGGELAGTLFYTPPVTWPVVPFVTAEVGNRWEESTSGPLLGGGGGLHLGSPAARFGVRAGVVYNRWFVLGGIDIIRPMALVSVRF
jgi:hypothetical protein